MFFLCQKNIISLSYRPYQMTNYRIKVLNNVVCVTMMNEVDKDIWRIRTNYFKRFVYSKQIFKPAIFIVVAGKSVRMYKGVRCIGFDSVSLHFRIVLTMSYFFS